MLRRRDFLQALPGVAIGTTLFDFNQLLRAQAIPQATPVLTTAEVTEWQNAFSPLLVSALSAKDATHAAAVRSGLSARCSKLITTLRARGFDEAFSAGAREIVKTVSFTAADVTTAINEVAEHVIPVLKAHGYEGSEAATVERIHFGAPGTPLSGQLEFMSEMIQNWGDDESFLDDFYDAAMSYEDPTASTSLGCEAYNLMVGLLSAAFWSLSFGCAPVEPLFVVICPVIAVINIILAILAVVAMMLC